MTLTIELDSDLEARLAAAANVQGMKMQEYARDLIRKAVSVHPSQVPAVPLPLEESAFLDSLAANGTQSAELSEQTFSREFLYSNHD